MCVSGTNFKKEKNKKKNTLTRASVGSQGEAGEALTHRSSAIADALVLAATIAVVAGVLLCNRSTHIPINTHNTLTLDLGDH